MSSRGFYWFVFTMTSLVIVMLLIGCGTPMEIPTIYTKSDQGGVSGRIIHLPVSPEASLQCVQGVNGSFSHQGRATRYDIDLDTSNVKNESVFAPANGIVFVHTENRDHNFGYHVNIDLGDGTYVVIAHMQEIVVIDGSEVATGQLLGYEGCTGNCTGDHIHIGLHRGDASRMAENGESISVSYKISNNATVRAFETVRSEDFRCGIRSFGDPYDGLYYTSVLDPVRWHPNGTLIKTPGDPRVFRIDDGFVRWISSENAFHSYKYHFGNVAIVSDEELDCYYQGPDIAQSGFVDAVQDRNDQIWLIVGPRGREDRYRIRVLSTGWEAVLESWGLTYNMEMPMLVSNNHDLLENWPVVDGHARFRDGTIVKERQRSDLYVISDGKAMPIKDWNTYLLLGFHSRQFVSMNAGTLELVQGSVGDCRVSSWCIDHDSVLQCGGDLDNVDANPTLPTARDRNAHDVGGEPINEEPEVSEPEPESQGHPEEPQAPEEVEEPEVVSVSEQCNDPVCLADLDRDGRNETILLAQDLWIEPELTGVDAFVYANGGCFDGVIGQDDIVHAGRVPGFYALDMTGHNVCESEFSLVSSVGTDGNPPNHNMQNWFWLQIGAFCSTGSKLCMLMDNGREWEEWLLAISWNSDVGLTPIGNALTRNDQL